MASQTGRRVNGATLYNQRVDALFAYLEYKLLSKEKGGVTEKEIVDFLRSYDGDAFFEWDDSRIISFASGRSLRKGNEEGMKARKERHKKISNYPPTVPSPKGSEARKGGTSPSSKVIDDPNFVQQYNQREENT